MVKICHWETGPPQRAGLSVYHRDETAPPTPGLCHRRRGSNAHPVGLRRYAFTSPSDLGPRPLTREATGQSSPRYARPRRVRKTAHHQRNRPSRAIDRISPVRPSRHPPCGLLRMRGLSQCLLKIFPHAEEPGGGVSKHARPRCSPLCVSGPVLPAPASFPPTVIPTPHPSFPRSLSRATTRERESICLSVLWPALPAEPVLGPAKSRTRGCGRYDELDN
jgi:hypothetical protein